MFCSVLYRLHRKQTMIKAECDHIKNSHDSEVSCKLCWIESQRKELEIFICGIKSKGIMLDFLYPNTEKSSNGRQLRLFYEVQPAEIKTG